MDKKGYQKVGFVNDVGFQRGKCEIEFFEQMRSTGLKHPNDASNKDPFGIIRCSIVASKLYLNSSRAHTHLSVSEKNELSI
jgi:hypothetical protein